MRKTNSTLTVERLKDVLNYDPNTGVFIWKVAISNKRKGSLAGYLKACGYVRIRLDRQSYFAHRLAWFYSYGVWPSDLIDHISRVPSENGLKNLREATQSQNLQNTGSRKNNTSGFPGVSWAAERGKWLAQINIKGKNTNLGRYVTAEAAYKAYCDAAAKYHTHNPNSSNA